MKRLKSIQEINSFLQQTFYRYLALATVYVFAFAGNVQGQKQFNNSTSYRTAIGLRAGGPGEITIKHFTGQAFALEGVIGMWNSGFRTKLLFEPHQKIGNAEGLRFYYGAGPQLSFYDRNYWYNNGRDRYYAYESDELGLGVAGVVGLEYKFPPLPIALSLDLCPSFEFVSDGSVWTDFNPGLGLKFTF